MSTALLIAAACHLLTACAAFTSPAAPPEARILSVATLPQASPSMPDTFVWSRLTVPDGDQPSIEAGVWWPAGPSPTPRPLIVISHGNGGDFRSHRDTAEALAQAGFIVATLTHTGDNWRDQSRATDIVDRARQLSVLIDHMLGQWDGRAGIDAGRIGAFGFSAGGFTVLTAAGGKPDLTRLFDHCRTNPDFFDCRLISRHPETLQRNRQGGAPLPHDSRIKALVVAAPALGFTFTRQGLADVTQPVQLWQAGADEVLPSPFYVEPVRAALPRQPEYHRVDGAGHFDFLSPCTPELAANAPIICTPTPGLDRAEFHEAFNREIIRFFRAQL